MLILFFYFLFFDNLFNSSTLINTLEYSKEFQITFVSSSAHFFSLYYFVRSFQVFQNYSSPKGMKRPFHLSTRWPYFSRKIALSFFFFFFSIFKMLFYFSLLIVKFLDKRRFFHYFSNLTLDFLFTLNENNLDVLKFERCAASTATMDRTPLIDTQYNLLYNKRQNIISLKIELFLMK